MKIEKIMRVINNNNNNNNNNDDDDDDNDVFRSLRKEICDTNDKY